MCRHDVEFSIYVFEKSLSEHVVERKVNKKVEAMHADHIKEAHFEIERQIGVVEAQIDAVGEQHRVDYVQI